jgi:inosine/xanthosine triphosphate pyrophosphatase family protein
MTKKLLMATGNPHKKERFQNYLKQLGISVISFGDLKNNIEVTEDGKTPEENALKKVRAGFDATGIPSFGVDYWLFIDGLPDDIQPGAFVRRIFKGDHGERVEATDEEMLDYYSDLVERLGGKTKGKWISAIALVVDKDKHFIERFERVTTLTSKVGQNRTEGEPLNSLQIDPKSGKYFTDFTTEEWLELQKQSELGYIRFFEEHIQDLV